ncbi:MAG: MBL fold metallo-hydrolase [Oscillospiraceae bacterium]|nr:MBL fold metallo-hydrolase [Oscillospiraceae bacterium]
MKITFIAHSAFLVELEEMNLLFDWTGEQILPVFDRNKPLYVFASHHHGDHYTPKIFSLGMDNVRYILATCIRLSAKRKAGLGIDDSCIYRLRAGVTQTIGEVTVTTVRSNDAGVAFVVKTAEGSFFHAGDLNDWYWAEEAAEWNEMIKAGFLKSIEALKGTEVDVSFLPLDGRLGEAFYWGFHQFMDTVECKKAFPMHCWGDFSVVEKLKQLPTSKSYRSRVADVSADGQVFYL